MKVAQMQFYLNEKLKSQWQLREHESRVVITSITFVDSVIS